ncbi:uncharacterized protein RAG0_03896 [Rhynchosporium agropyri]|uniref:MaoC-like domain-containing protein n=1 Tax=Rhynchosporium agropyri TaxID=914238 RepID=A0A1E1K6P5_9HELO|nr:uncharacterized protein RAG0_03896 [Rhynchosporium agropyri]
MIPTTLFAIRRICTGALQPVNSLHYQRAAVRYSSSEAGPPVETSSHQQTLHAELTSRPSTTTLDRLSETPQDLLKVSLADFLPPSCLASITDYLDPDSKLNELQAGTQKTPVQRAIPQGYHLAYFPPSVLDSGLLPDGTDTLHSPGAPFLRRLWAGGSLRFNPIEKHHMRMDQMATCQETISDVNVKGIKGQENVFVTVERQLATCRSSLAEKSLKKRAASGNKMAETLLALKYKNEDIFPLAAIETRNLVFMREKSKEEAKEDLLKTAKIVKPTHTPDFSVSLTPNAALLFRFSALSFNAHRIHLDPQYTREVEGYRNLLVHGPLTLVLMLSVLRSQIEEGKMVLQFDYRNLAPLYVDEEMRICVRKDPTKQDRFDVWVEGKEGGYAVKGTATAGNVVLSDPKEAGKASSTTRKVSGPSGAPDHRGGAEKDKVDA